MPLSFLPDFLISRFHRKQQGCHIDALPIDVIVDLIFPYFSIEDIIRVRRVSKLFYYLSHEPIIWKRFLYHMEIPLPRLPPTTRYALHNVGSEAEKMVIRALSLDDNWREFETKPFEIQGVKAFNEVLTMTVLPGGKYLVASVADSGHKRYAIIVFILDCHGKPAVALAKTPTKSKAYNLQAKYMTWKGTQGITIAYVRREFLPGGRKLSGMNPSDFTPDAVLDLPCPLRYECVCLHISLDSLELLGDSKIPHSSYEFYQHAVNQPPPFREVSQIRSGSSRLDDVTLFEFEGNPFVAVVKQPDMVVIKDLTDGYLSTLQCEKVDQYSEFEHSIRNIRVFPSQNQIFVIRSIKVISNGRTPAPRYRLELYDPPARGTLSKKNPRQYFTIDKRQIVSFQVSDHNYAPFHDHSLQPHLPSAEGSPPPISIFGRTKHPNGLIHYSIWPSFIEVQSTTACSGRKRLYYYSTENTTWQSRHDSGNNAIHILPGAFRALLYTVPASDRTHAPSLIKFRRYVNPVAIPDDYPLDFGPPDDRHVMKKRKMIPQNIFADVRLTPNLERVLRRDGVMAVAWDESVGRACIASANDSVIHIVDFAQTPTIP